MEDFSSRDRRGRWGHISRRKGHQMVFRATEEDWSSGERLDLTTRSISLKYRHVMPTHCTSSAVRKDIISSCTSQLSFDNVKGVSFAVVES